MPVVAGDEPSAAGISRENSGAEIKAMADYITDSVEKGGLYKALEMLGLLNKQQI